MGSKLDRLVVHIGSHRSGSTAVQEYCAFHNAALAAQGVHYPLGLFANYADQHSELESLCQRKNAVRLNALFQRIVQGAVERDCKTVFLSGEELCFLGPPNIRLLARVADRHFAAKMFVLVVRTRGDFLLSNYKHHLLKGPPISDLGFARAFTFSPAPVIDIWRTYFSPDAVCIAYSDIEKDLVRQFLRRALGIEVESSSARANASLDLLTLAVCNTFLKQWMHRDIESILYDFSVRYPNRHGFQLDRTLYEDLMDWLPSDGWDLPDFQGERGLNESASITIRPHDPSEVCERMIDLFTQLKAHFDAAKKPEVGPEIRSENETEVLAKQ